MRSCAWSGMARSARRMVANKLSNRSFDQAAEPAALDVTFRSSEDGVIRAGRPGSCISLLGCSAQLTAASGSGHNGPPAMTDGLTWNQKSASKARQRTGGPAGPSATRCRSSASSSMTALTSAYFLPRRPRTLLRARASPMAPAHRQNLSHGPDVFRWWAKCACMLTRREGVKALTCSL